MSPFISYLNAISELNRLTDNGPVQWMFYTGMLFSSPDKWWGDFKIRASVHEGIDITYYQKDSGVTCQFDTTTRIPAFSNGIILNICADFLGHSMVVEALNPEHPDYKIVFVYAHVNPVPGLDIGSRIHQQQPIATVCDTRKNPLLPPHLHFSCFEIRADIPPEHLNWNLFSKPGSIRMFNPVWL